MKVQTIFRILLIIIVLILSVLAFRSIMRPEKFKLVYTERETEIRNRLVTLRAAQQVYKIENKTYADNIDKLVDFVKNGTVTIVKINGSIPEGLSEADAFAKGFITKSEEKYPASKKILEIDENVKEINLKNFHLIPENDGKKFTIQTATIHNTFQVYRIDVSLDEVLANMDRSISPKENNFITRGINFILYNGLEKEKQYRNLYKPMWMGSLTEAVTTGSWE